MANVFDVAKYFLEELGTLSTWKLQKLCYYAFAYHLAWTEKILFNEDFQAWVNGPVCKELYNLHKGEFQISSDFLSVGDPDALNEDELESLEVVLNSYGNKEPYWLRELSHSETPWKEAREGLLNDERGERVISKKSIGEYYGSLNG